uniref:Prostate stem cell antigen-like n=1 Tax=Geotrypetes seraphini TaxID=260995 RepID=A0A6P8QV84_GEOSA|nr:prostate stem cell antigen-like [Geotrypetes seraphini]
MKTFLLSLLAAALCLHPARSLKCYSCAVAEKNSDCVEMKKCSPEQKYCKTGVHAFSSLVAIIKECTDECFPFNSEYGESRSSVYCCQTDLCNYSEKGPSEDKTSAAVSLRISYLALAVSVGFVGFLL